MGGHITLSLAFTIRGAQSTAYSIRIYDLRTDKHFTLKKNPLKAAGPEDLVTRYAADNRSQRESSEGFKCFEVDELPARDNIHFDIVWLNDGSLEDIDGLPLPDVIGTAVVDNLEAALNVFQAVSDEPTTNASMGERWWPVANQRLVIHKSINGSFALICGGARLFFLSSAPIPG